MISVFNIHARNIVGQQYDFVRLEFLLELAFQIFLVDETALNQAGHKGSGPRERVDDIHVLVGEPAPEF